MEFKILHIVGARPNFMKMAPVAAALEAEGAVRQIIVHTGQHYDEAMSAVFFRQLSIPDPDYNLGVGPGTHAQQTAGIMLKLEPLVRDLAPDMVLVYGDVNSTIAGALVCAKLGVPVAHVEAGLRSFDRTMPEELNRLLTDQLADLLFTPSPDANENLAREGIAPEKIHLVGNVMIDTLVRLLPLAGEKAPHQALGILPGTGYILATLHRPKNVDDPGSLLRIMEALADIAKDCPVIFPVHPRTRKCLEETGAHRAVPGIVLADPMGYLEFLSLQAGALVVVTDSGGIQEETTYLRVPCCTVRENTERPITVENGTNVLVGADMEKLKKHVKLALSGKGKKGSIPHLWDGRAASRIADILLRYAASGKKQGGG